MFKRVGIKGKEVMKNKESHELITEYVKAQNEWAVKANNPCYKTTKLAQKCAKIERELVARGLLTEEDIKRINA